MLLSYIKLYLKNEGRKIGEVNVTCHANMAHEHYEPHLEKEKENVMTLKNGLSNIFALITY
jgi:hypothetical protein